VIKVPAPDPGQREASTSQPFRYAIEPAIVTGHIGWLSLSWLAEKHVVANHSSDNAPLGRLVTHQNSP
jgi:hypothetical protein